MKNNCNIKKKLFAADWIKPMKFNAGLVIVSKNWEFQKLYAAICNLGWVTETIDGSNGGIRSAIVQPNNGVWREQ